jgi:ADP-heptose:LPS heptosyltransferase
MAGAIARFSRAQPGAEARADVLLVGGPADRDRGGRIAALAGGTVRSLCGGTSLRTTFALAKASDAVLTNASMLAHTAAAFRRPTVVVLGGMHQDRDAYDRLWGYPPPYRSVAPAAGEAWPDIDTVVAAIVGVRG